MSDNDDWDDLDDTGEIITNDQDAVNALMEDMEFERKFYEAVCHTDQFEVIPIPDENGRIITKEEKQLLEATARQHKIKILYRISHKKFATVFDPDTGLIGVMPETNSQGFTC